MTPIERKKQLGKMFACRSFLRISGILTDSMNEAIHKKIMAHQDKYRINISTTAIDKACKDINK